MGRSVSYPTGAEVTFLHPTFWERAIDKLRDTDAYQDATEDEQQSLEEELEYDYHDFDDLEDVLFEQAREAWPSMSPCKHWVGREDHAITENGHAWFGLSEYCGLVAVWLVAKDRDNALAEAWVAQASRKLHSMGQLRKVATMSNGEAVFERVQS